MRGIQYAAVLSTSLRAKQAIHLFAVPRHGLLRFARNDGDSTECTFAFSRRMCPRFARKSSPSKTEGAGNAGCTLHPRSRVQSAQRNAHEHTGTDGAFRHSLRNGFTAYFVLSPATNSSCHRRWRINGLIEARLGRLRLRQLDTSNGCQDHTVLPYASAPFVLRAVRSAHGKPALRSRPAPDAAASTASRPTFVTIAIRPSCRDGMARILPLICPTAQAEYFCCEGLDRLLRLICPSGSEQPERISACKRSNSSAETF